MNFYAHYIGDYDADTMDLSSAEDCAYSRLLRFYYATEKPLENTPDRLATITRARTAADRAAIPFVVGRFFYVGRDGKLHNARADKELRKAKTRIRVASENGKKGGRPKTQSKAKRNPAGLANESSPPPPPSPPFPTGREMVGRSVGPATISDLIPAAVARFPVDPFLAEVQA